MTPVYESGSRPEGRSVDPGSEIDCRQLSTKDLVEQIQPLCDAGYVADLTLRDGSVRTVLLIGVSTTALIVDRWDAQLHRPANDPSTVHLAEVARVVVP